VATAGCWSPRSRRSGEADHGRAESPRGYYGQDPGTQALRLSEDGSDGSMVRPDPCDR